MTLMKYIPVAFAVALSIPAVADEMNAGTVHFTGEIIEPSCIIDGNDGKDNNVPLGTYPTSLFVNPGDESSLIPFDIQLKNCPLQTTGLTSVQLTFEGPTVATSNADLLSVSAITTAGSEAATNIGVAVSTLDRTETLLKMDGSEGQVAIDLPTNSDSVRGHFVARYRAFAIPVTPGPADADMTVNILYR
ncbi:type 1 fimbriae major subunit [Trabulsiella guamensis ATCC 49490]|uniref:Type 1 fimbriae major subunit n=1 Tax=Trabulsiella guamensis ATCC 49490 TaxID=1005994 RepID=A0A085ASH8_9ENTR|nr:fimbrial protein [Trabulsiella guamensis]KFC13173.1 type 1 fimbriae major subunit [Trabulsiella guamensis ATCC 49490]